MKIEDYAVGQRFAMGGGGNEWLCTDIGRRVVVAIRIDDSIRADPSWMNGLPYAVSESVIDEHSMEGCAPTLAAWVEEFGEESLVGIAGDRIAEFDIVVLLVDAQDGDGAPVVAGTEAAVCTSIRPASCASMCRSARKATAG